MEPYYYNHLSKTGQGVYYAMLNGFQNLSPSIQAPLMDIRDINSIYFYLRLDHPELFYLEGFKCMHYPDSANVEIIPEYLFDKKKILGHRQALKARIEKLVRPAKDLKETEKILYVHDFICRSVHYDKLKKAYSHEIIGPLGQGVGVCEGIAKSVKILLDELKIWNVIALCDNNPEKGIKYRHTWNVVRAGGKYYHLDVTFDNSLGDPDNIRYDYFLLPDKQIFRDHEPLIVKMPECTDADLFYYKQKKLSFTKTEEVRKRAMQAAKKGKRLVFHWRGGYLTREMLSELLKIVDEEASEKEMYAVIALNWPQAVIGIRFEKEMPDERIVVQEANEGEQE